MQLDHKLNFRTHINPKIKNPRQHVMRLQSSMGKLWGPNPYLTRWAYFCPVRPALTFGNFVWVWKATVSTIRRKLERLQAMALRMSGHFSRSTPKVGMEMIPMSFQWTSSSSSRKEEGVQNAMTIYSDSQLVLQTLNSHWNTSQTV